jgi:pteridine reductase
VENTTGLAAGKVALVTGGARRIGAAIVRELHRQGAYVVVHYRSSARQAQALAGELEQQRPGSCQILQGDLLDLEFLASMTKTATRAFGGLDLLVNNASSFYPTTLDGAGARDWEALMGANLRAPFFLAQGAHGVLRERRGSIVNVIDIYAEHPLRGFPIYSASKSGLAGLTRSLALELAPEVRVNGVSPGTILWPESQTGENPAAILAQLPLQRAGEPEDIATAVRFLAFEAPYVTGHILAVDGGRSLRL